MELFTQISTNQVRYFGSEWRYEVKKRKTETLAETVRLATLQLNQIHGTMKRKDDRGRKFYETYFDVKLYETYAIVTVRKPSTD